MTEMVGSQSLMMAYSWLRDTVSWKMAFICSSVMGLTWLITKLVKTQLMTPLRKIPSRPRGHLLYGNMKDYFSGQDMDIFVRWVREMKTGVIRYYHCLGQQRLAIADADAMKHIMVTNANNYVRPNYVKEVFTRAIGINLLFMNEDEHLVHRRLCSQAFKTPVLQRMIPAIQKHAEMLVERWTGILRENEGGLLDINGDLSRMASDTIAKCGFGLDMDSLKHPDVAVTNAFNSVSKYKPGPLRFVLPALSMMLPTEANRRFARNLKLCDRIIKTAMDAKTSLIERESEDEDYSDILSVLLLARDAETGARLTPKQLRDHAMFFFAAGIQNTATCMSWCLLTLARNLEVQERVRREVMEHLPPKGEDITLQHLHQMKYLTCVIKETLRLHPVITNFAKQALKDDVINGYTIPAGTTVTLCVEALHRNPEYWENPDEFEPERFLDENATNHAWVPFGAGPKMCLGYKFSLIEMKTTMALLLRDLDFRSVSDQVYRKKKCITMFPDPPLKLTATILDP